MSNTMQWVKASERLPETFWASEEMGNGSLTLSLKYKGNPCAGRYVIEAGLIKECFVIAGFGFYGSPNYEEIEWLEESESGGGMAEALEAKFTIEQLKKMYEAGQEDCGEFGAVRGFEQMAEETGIDLKSALGDK